MMLTEEVVDSIAADAHAAALGALPWVAVLEKLARELDASGAALFTPALDPVGRSLSADWGTAAEATRDYLQHWVLEDPWIEAAVAHGAWDAPGAIAAGRQILPLDRLHRTAFFNDFARRQDIQEIVSLKAIGDDDRWAPVTHFSFFSKRVDAFEREHVRALRQVWPHLQRAIQTYWVLQKARTTDLAVQQALESFVQPVWVVRQTLEIDFANLAARKLLGASRSGVSTAGIGNGRLRALGDLDDGALRLALTASLSSGGRTLVAGFSLEGRLRRAVLRLAPIPAKSPYATAWPSAAALIVLDPPLGPDEAALWQRHLAQRFKLTATESRVLAAISAARTPEEISAELGVSVATVRTHLARLFDKTGCRRQAELVRLSAGQ